MNGADGVLQRNPTTGIVDCCARAASGHAAAAPPSSAMISRRFIIQSPHQQARAASEAGSPLDQQHGDLYGCRGQARADYLAAPLENATLSATLRPGQEGPAGPFCR